MADNKFRFGLELLVLKQLSYVSHTVVPKLIEVKDLLIVKSKKNSAKCNSIRLTVSKCIVIEVVDFPQ
ncbi:hypothetical protein BLOT_012935 [Blomia tropicalis]|nr:hypothetical protein BLOT_012935 [Blomia tropicalis]